jgi:hypothetical protein
MHIILYFVTAFLSKNILRAGLIRKAKENKARPPHMVNRFATIAGEKMVDYECITP